MNKMLSVAISQINPTVGDLEGNFNLILKKYLELCSDTQELDLVVFPELALTGYPPEDLVQKSDFQKKVKLAIQKLSEKTMNSNTAMIIGAPWLHQGKLYNAALLLENGAISEIIYKWKLPNYGVFDEHRIFCSGILPKPINFRGYKLGVMICEDMWSEEVTKYLMNENAQILIVLNASPFEIGKTQLRMNYAKKCVNTANLPLIYVNQVGGQDELVFDGSSFILNAGERVLVSLSEFVEDSFISRWVLINNKLTFSGTPQLKENLTDLHNIYLALMLGLRDYVHKNNFKEIVLGLSGGIDSALCAAIVVDALGPSALHCIMMPSEYTSKESIEDALVCSKLLGITSELIPIHLAKSAYHEMLNPFFKGLPSDLTEENIQSRIRGMILMALSNKFGWMVLSTGNKSEISVGYSTLYGDSCGGYSVLKDIYKTKVFALSKWRNQNFPIGGLGPNGVVIPDTIINKAPSAELRPNQTDQDSLPPYDILDGILHCLIEYDMGVDETVEQGFDKETVVKVLRMLNASEYKRRQSPPGVKITSKCFGRDRRYPITHRFIGKLLELQ